MGNLPLVEIPVTIFDQRVMVKTIVGTNGPPLLGRNAFLGVMEFGIDYQGWLNREARKNPGNAAVEFLRAWIKWLVRA
jgi:hypothetical protein